MSIKLESENNIRRFSLRNRLAILFIVIALPFVAFSVYNAYEVQNELQRGYETENINLAKNVAMTIDDSIASTGELLISMSSIDFVRNQNYPAIKRYLEAVWPNYPYYSNIIFVDNNGDIQAASRTKQKGKMKVNVRDTVYFKRAMQSESVAVGDFMVSKILGKPVVHVTFPVKDYSGKRVGFLAAAFDLTKVQNKIMQHHVREHTLISVLDNKFVIVARSESPGKWVGKSVAGTMRVEHMIGKKSGSSKVQSAIDGKTRIVGFAAASRVPWFVRVGTDYNYIQLAVKQAILKQLAIFIPILLIAIFGWLWIGRDVEKLHRRTEFLSLTDSLTQLWNNRKLLADLEREISRAKRNREQLSFIMLDIDHFKVFNDKYGHQAGDKVLSCVAKTICNIVRDTDLVYRYGGEEICVLAPSTDREGAVRLAERIRYGIEQSHVQCAGQDLADITVSLGVASYPLDAISRDGLIRCADEALYRAKANGRNRVEGYTLSSEAACADYL